MSSNQKIGIIAAVVLVLIFCGCCFLAGVAGLLFFNVSRSSMNEYHYNQEQTVPIDPFADPLNTNPDETYTVPAIPGYDPFNDMGAGGGLFPNETAYYHVQLTGSGDESFSRSGCMVIEPNVSTSGSQQDGINEMQVGLFAGNPNAGSAGSIWWATNTQLLCENSSTDCATSPGAQDLAQVTVDRYQNTLVASPNGVIDTMIGNFNIFAAPSGASASVYQTQSGVLKMQFLEDGSVEGEVDFFGGGFDNPNIAIYQAGFTGFAVDGCDQ